MTVFFQKYQKYSLWNSKDRLVQGMSLKLKFFLNVVNISVLITLLNSIKGKKKKTDAEMLIFLYFHY